MFENRNVYRSLHRKNGLVSFEITVKETNLNIQATTDLTDSAIRSALKYRLYIETHIRQYPEFSTALSPLPPPSFVPGIVMDMMKAAQLANVGPMAAVAGAMAEYVGRDLLEMSPEIMVENGGDIFIRSTGDTVFSIYAANSPLSMTTGIKVEPQDTAFAMCTSSGTLGHSKSFGTADAVSIMAPSGCLADAAATALCNMVKDESDIENTLRLGQQIQGIQGIVIIKNEKIGLWGNIKLVRLT
jgi:uncharacterized protein